MIVGDAHQRIYGKTAILSKCGINVVGRSSKLKLNYRTTEKIRRRAVALLKGMSVDDLDGAKDNDNGFRSLVVGLAPIESRFKTFAREMDAIAETIRNWQKDDGRKFSDYAVLVRGTDDVAAVMAALGERRLTCRQLTKERSLRASEEDSVRVATMHRSKGLEFAGVVIAEINKGNWPLRPAEYQDMDPV